MAAGEKEIKGRRCYEHLGGKLGALFFERVLALGWIELDEGRSAVYRVTPAGREGFARLGLELPAGEMGEKP